MTDCGIYRITHVDSGKSYVGQSMRIHARWEQHKRGKGRSSALSEAISRYGADAFCFEVLEYCGREELNARERYWVRLLNTIHPNGYNLTSGGGQATEVSDRTRNRIREATSAHLRELNNDPDNARKISDAKKAACESPEVRKRMSESFRGSKACLKNLERLNRDPEIIEKRRQTLLPHLARLNSDPEVRRKAAETRRRNRGE